MECLDWHQAEVYQQLLERCTHLDEASQRMLAVRIGGLLDYQDAAYATTYVDFVLQVGSREAETCPGHTELTQAVIRDLYKLLAYKLRRILSHLNEANHALAVVIAQAPDAIRGSEDIQMRRVAETKQVVAQYLKRLATSSAVEALPPLTAS